MIAIKIFVLHNTGLVLRQAVLFIILTLLLNGPIGCVVPIAGQGYQTSPILNGILVEDRSTGIAQFRTATAQEFQEVRILRREMRLDAMPNMRLHIGDEVWIGPGAAAAIRFPNGSQLYLRSNSRVRIGSVFAFVGELFVRVRGVFQVDTEFVTAGAEGTEWVMMVWPNGDTRSTVLDGRVRIASRKNFWRPMLIVANIQNLTRDSRYTETMRASPEELNEMKRWIGQIDRLVRAPESPMSEYNRPPLFQFYFNSLHRRPDRHPGEYRPDRSDRSSDPNPGVDAPLR